MPAEKKIACYTCITNGYDTVRDPIVISDSIDYVCFTDNPNIQSNVWKFRPIPDDLQRLSFVKQQRIVKICPHRYLPEYDTSIWVDGNILIKGDLNKLIQEYDLNSIPFYTRIHPSRNCVYDEAKAVLSFRKDRPEIVNRIIQRYRLEGYPCHIGIAETCVILRRHNDRKCILVDNAWAAELLLNSHRDQLSFNYVCWKMKFLPGYMVNQFNIKNNEYFQFNRHG